MCCWLLFQFLMREFESGVQAWDFAKGTPHHLDPEPHPIEQSVLQFFGGYHSSSRILPEKL